jgi:chromosome segregation protein
LLSQKLSKEDLARKVGELELKIKRKQDEVEEVRRRFNEHMQSNERTERSLYERIADMQAQLELLQKLRDEDKYQVQQTQKVVELKEAEIEEKKDAIKSLQKKVSSLKDEIACKKAEVEELKQQLVAQEEQMSNLRSLSEKSKDEQRQEYLNIIQQQKAEIKSLNSKIESLGAKHEKHLQELNAQLEQLQG